MCRTRRQKKDTSASFFFAKEVRISTVSWRFLTLLANSLSDRLVDF